eukprot:TRINITY_DN1961_c0_g1_i1.p1 TRINITY_DN1961_c0_g1~~TRINITY_DN1961_c0_g1_i1.p1  ORF type:complete len:181 (+),score=11.21 TRINITY_DN1961_c0_g1_i1:237-779(+)
MIFMNKSCTVPNTTIQGKKYRTYIIQMYMLNYNCYCTNERITHLETFSDIVKMWGNSPVSKKNAPNWRNCLKDSDLWKNVPDFSFLAYHWFQTFVQPIIRSKVHKIDTIRMNGPPSIQQTERELRTLTIGQWDEKSKYEGMLSPDALVEKMFFHTSGPHVLQEKKKTSRGLDSFGRKQTV